MSMKTEAFSDFVDRVRYVILKAPNHFPTDTGMNLEKSFELLYDGLEYCEDKFSSRKAEVRWHLDESLAAYRRGDVGKGIKELQSIDNLARTGEIGVLPR